MPILPVQGHGALRQRIQSAAESGTLPSSLLLQGPRGIGKQRLALWIGQLLLCDGDAPRPCGACAQCRRSLELAHPDLHWFFPRLRKDFDGSPEEVRVVYDAEIAERVAAHSLYPAASGSAGIFIGTVHAILRRVAMTPALARRKVVIVGDAERMVSQEGADEAANAFLKLLEEPPGDTTIVLTSSEPAALLPTVRSRVSPLRISRLADADMKAFLNQPPVREALGSDTEKETAERLRLADGAPGSLLDRASLDRARASASLLHNAGKSGNPAARYRAAMTQGSSGARGEFSNTLDALTALLHEDIRIAAQRGDAPGAVGASRTIDGVEDAKLRAMGNVNPQLLAAGILVDMARKSP